MPLAVLAGCGTPATLSPAERAAQKAQQERHAAAERRRAALEQERAAAAAKRAAQALTRAKHAMNEAKLNAYNASQLKLDPLPPDVHQIGSAFFIADQQHANELRHVCTGRYDSGDGSAGNDVDSVNILSNGQIEVKCQGPQERFRSENWETAYAKRTGHR